MRICFDVDGVICNNTYGDYEKAKPNMHVIKKINKMFSSGYFIILYTARGMGRYKGDVKKAYNRWYKITEDQMKSWGVKYNVLLLGKPEADFYVDDKAIKFNSVFDLDNIKGKI